jgi:hypothetical protein
VKSENSSLTYVPGTFKNGLRLDQPGRSAMKTWRAELACVLSF